MSATITLYTPCFNFAINEIYRKKKYVEFPLGLYNDRKNKRWNKRFKEIFKPFISRSIYGGMFINCEEIKYRQGWWFKKKLFNEKISIHYATTKKRSEELLNRLLDFKYEEAVEAKESFLKALDGLEDNKFILEIAW